MEVILLERIERLGQMGDVVTVKPGYARNYLLPQKKALRATKENREHFEGQRAQLEADNLTRRNDAEAAAAKMEGVSIVVIRQAGESGNLYGSVAARDIAAQLGEDGYTVARQQVAIDTPIKTLGLHSVRVSLHPEVGVSVTVNVAKSEEEARAQAEAAARGEEIAEAAEAVPGEPAEAVVTAPEEVFEDAAQAAKELETAVAEDEASEAEAEKRPPAEPRPPAQRQTAERDTVEDAPAIDDS